MNVVDSSGWLEYFADVRWCNSLARPQYAPEER